MLKVSVWNFDCLNLRSFLLAEFRFSENRSLAVQKAHLVLYTYQNSGDDYGPVLCRCTVIADLLIRERHKPFVLIPVASLERADIWHGCLFFTQKVLPEIQVLLWNESFLVARAFQGLRSSVPLSCHPHQDHNTDTHQSAASSFTLGLPSLLCLYWYLVKGVSLL